MESQRRKRNELAGEKLPGGKAKQPASAVGKRKDAERQQVFQDRGMVIIALSLTDLNASRLLASALIRDVV